MTAVTALTALGQFLATNPSFELTTAAKPATGQTQHELRYVPLNGAAKAYFQHITTETVNVAQAAELRPLDLTYKPEAGTVEWVDLATVPAVRAACERLAELGELSNFAPADDKYKKRLLYWAGVRQADGKRAFLFRSFSQAAELKRKKLAAIVVRDGPFELLDEQVFLFDENVDCVVYDGYVYVLRRNDYRRIFDQLEQVRHAALTAAARLNERVPIQNFAEFAESCANQPAMADKLIAVERRDYFPQLSYDLLAPVIAEFELPIQIDNGDGNPKLVFDSALEHRWRILRLVDDDYLRSSMTNHRYEVNSKTTTQ
jgi:hypothetical protein